MIRPALWLLAVMCMCVPTAAVWHGAEYGTIWIYPAIGVLLVIGLIAEYLTRERNSGRPVICWCDRYQYLAMAGAAVSRFGRTIAEANQLRHLAELDRRAAIADPQKQSAARASVAAMIGS